MNLILQAKGVERSYENSGTVLPVLKGIDLEIKQGEVAAIVGPSGAGKSTLLHILGGLDKPNKGEVFLQDDNIYKMNDKSRARLRNEKIGFVFQFYHLLPEFTALENVLLPLMIKEDSRNIKSFEEKGRKALSRMKLENRIQHKPNQLSGGEQQRVAIARALINEPKIIFCDEPTGNLDSQSGKQIISLLLELNRDNRQTIVIVTHDEYIAKVSSRIVNIFDGKILKSA